VKLLIQTPNAKNKCGFNIDRYVFNPTCTSSKDMKHFQFLGILFGVAMRTKKPLDLHLAQPMWKLLAGMVLTSEDLEEVCMCTCVCCEGRMGGGGRVCTYGVSLRVWRKQFPSNSFTVKEVWLNRLRGIVQSCHENCKSSCQVPFMFVLLSTIFSLLPQVDLMFMQLLYSIRDVHIKEEEFSEVCTQSCN